MTFFKSCKSCSEIFKLYESNEVCCYCFCYFSVTSVKIYEINY